MARQRVNFEGQHGALAGSLELTATEPRAFALFAHCFTCGKDSAAASRISRALAAEGIAVLRFDFTGLGGSDGDFAHTDFSSNIDDLVAAADFLRHEHAAPALLIGHSLGGTAVLAAAERIPESTAVVTIGAPASPEHVVAQFGADAERIEQDGEAEVSLAGRPFKIRKSFLDDLRGTSIEARIRGLRRGLLVMHSPVDSIVEIGEASKIFAAALHPKSFISLDSADHLLTRADDAQYAATALTSWATHYLEIAKPESRAAVEPGHVRIGEVNQRFLRNVATDDHAWLADEPERVGGENRGPDPYEHLLAALGTCTSMTIRMYANHKQWPLDNIDVELEHSREHVADCEDCDDPKQKLDVIHSTIHLQGDLSEQQHARLVEIAGRCPVHKTLTSDLQIITREGS